MSVLILLAAIPLSAQDRTSPDKLDLESKVRAYLKENANDPARLSFVRFSKPFDSSGWKYINDKNGEIVAASGPAIYSKYRTASVFGGLILLDNVFLFGQDGKISKIIYAANFYPPGAKVPSDPPSDLSERFK